MLRWKLTEKEERLRHKVCPKCGSENLDPAGGWNSANGMIKCYDCGYGPFWWLREEAEEMKVRKTLNKYAGYALGVFCICQSTAVTWQGLWNNNRLDRVIGFIGIFVGFFIINIERKLQRSVKEAGG